MLDLTPIYPDEPLSVSQLLVFKSLDPHFCGAFAVELLSLFSNLLYVRFGLSLSSTDLTQDGYLKVRIHMRGQDFSAAATSEVKYIIGERARGWRIGSLFNRVQLEGYYSYPLQQYAIAMFKPVCSL